jgi:hypothetical protein
MTSLLNQEVQDIRIANLQKDVAFYAEAVSMLKRGWHRWLLCKRRTIYPGDFELDREIRERVMKGELNPKALDYLIQDQLRRYDLRRIPQALASVSPMATRARAHP